MDSIFNEIVREIKDHANNAAAKAVSLNCLEFGTLSSSGLKLDNFKYEIKDYLVLDYLKLSIFKPLQPGDRVLVATVSNEFVIVGRV